MTRSASILASANAVVTGEIDGGDATVTVNSIHMYDAAPAPSGLTATFPGLCLYCVVPKKLLVASYSI
jgi:hypothetical protein